MQTVLSDGSQAINVHLSQAAVVRGAATVGGSMWTLSKGSNVISVRNTRTGEVTSKVDILEEGIAIAAVGSRIWAATASNKIFVFGSDGTLLGALQPTGLPPVRQFFVLSESSLFTIGTGKDFAKWDTSQFTVERTFFGNTPGEIITSIALANRDSVSFIASSTMSLRCWSIDGHCIAELNEGATTVSTLFDKDKDTCWVWAAHPGWITVFKLPSTKKSSYFQREKTLPCAGVQQLLPSSGDHVVALDTEGIITVWSAATLTPVRSFKAAGLGSGSCLFCIRAAETKSAVLWTIGEGKGIIWQDECNVSLDGPQTDTSADLQADEINFLRSKLKYLQSTGTVYRQKIGLLFREKGISVGSSRPAHTIQMFNEVDQAYAHALESWDTENANFEPLPDKAALMAAQEASPSGEFTEYWKQKYHDALAEISQLKQEHESLSALLFDEKASPTELDMKRAAHICQLIKQKNELKEKERQLIEDVAKLRSKLREYNSPLGARGPGDGQNTEILKVENDDLRSEVQRLKSKIAADANTMAEMQHSMKHNQILKQRVKTLRAHLDEAQTKVSENSAQSQRDVEAMLQTIGNLEAQIEGMKSSTSDALRAKADAELLVVTKQALVDKLKAIAETADRELQQREAVERASQASIRNEIGLLCQSLDDRDKRISELQLSYNDACEQLKHRSAEAREATAALRSKQVEIDAISATSKKYEAIVLDRKNYARAICELQGRMEMVVEELRRSFTPVQFAASVEQLEVRVASLFSLEAQLKQKDDIIAMKDDQLQLMRRHATRVQEQIEKVSSVFMSLPRTVEEIELLMVEVDEYRRRLGADAETQEMIQIRLLELQAKRRAGEKLPARFDLTPTDTETRSKADMRNLQQLSATLQSVANSIGEDKTGLVRTPAPQRAGAAATAGEQQPAQQQEPQEEPSAVAQADADII